MSQGCRRSGLGLLRVPGDMADRRRGQGSLARPDAHPVVQRDGLHHVGRHRWLWSLRPALAVRHLRGHACVKPPTPNSVGPGSCQQTAGKLPVNCLVMAPWAMKDRAWQRRCYGGGQGHGALGRSGLRGGLDSWRRSATSKGCHMHRSARVQIRMVVASCCGTRTGSPLPAAWSTGCGRSARLAAPASPSSTTSPAPPLASGW